MIAKPMFDLTAKSAEELRKSFEISLSSSDVLLWEKSHQDNRDADISLPRFLFRTEVLEELEKTVTTH